MKKLLLLITIISSAFVSQAQTDVTVNALSAIQHLPGFTIYIAPDSTAFTNEQLKKKKPVILMFFSPDCDHCQKETKELMAYKEELKGLQIVMISRATFSEIKDFYKDYNIASMHNITMGQDPNFVLGLKYQVRTYPSMFVYDASGALAKAFVGNISIPAILDAIK